MTKFQRVLAVLTAGALLRAAWLISQSQLADGPAMGWMLMAILPASILLVCAILNE